MTISSIAYVENRTRNVRGSGVLITPDELLTAAHVVQDSNGVVSTNFAVSPGYNNGSAPFGTVGARNVHSAMAGMSGITPALDFALIHLSSPINGAGSMGLYGGMLMGGATVAGYPASAGTAQVSVSGGLTLASGEIYNGPALSGGGSGSPAWVSGQGQRFAVGLAESEALVGDLYTRLTEAAISRIKGWLIEDGEASAAAALTPGPTVALPTSTDGLEFDAVYYREQNPDVAAAGIDPEAHYLAFGWREGRNPNALFNTNWYLSRNVDVAISCQNPLEHFAAFGWKEGRDPSSGFSVAAYERANPDVAAAGLNPLFHYLNFGLGEGRRAA